MEAFDHELQRIVAELNRAAAPASTPSASPASSSGAALALAVKANLSSGSSLEQLLDLRPTGTPPIYCW